MNASSFKNNPLVMSPLRVLTSTLLDALSCMLLSIGVLFAFDQVFRFHADFGSIVGHVILFTLLLVLFTRRWWILPAVLGGCLLFFILAGLISGSFSIWLDWLMGLLDWWILLFPKRSMYNTPENIAVIQTVIHFLTVCVLYFCVRCIRSVIVVGLGAATFLAVIVSYGFHQNMLAAILLILLGLLPLLARNACPPAQNTRETAVHPNFRPQLAGVVICTVCCLISLFLLPLSTNGWKLFGSQKGSASGKQNINQLGASFDLSKLGGNIRLDNDEKVMEVVISPNLFALPMKSMTYENYTGKGWTRNSLETLDVENNMARFMDVTGFSVARNFSYSYPDIIRDNVTVTTFVPVPNLLYFGNLMTMRTMEPQSYMPLRFNQYGDITPYDPPFTGSYQFTGVFINRDSVHNYNLDVLLLTQSPDYQYTEIASRYQVLPDNLPASIYNTAAQVTAGSINSYEAACRLEDYFKQGYTYTLTPGKVPSDRDFVDYFLETKKGYCTYFATAMAVMARTAGIPARVATGYGMQYQDRNGTWVVLQSNAHAWVECYFENYGWITFDPTPGAGYVNPTPIPLPGTDASGNIPSNPVTNPPPTTIPPTTTTTSSGGESSSMTTTTPATTAPSSGPTGGDGFHPPIWLILTIVGILVLAVAAALFIHHIRYNLTRFRLEAVRKKYPEREMQAAYYYQDLLVQLSLVGYVPAGGETILQFVARMQENPDIPEKPVRDAFAVIMDWKYGEQPPQDEDVETLSRVHDEMEKLLKQKLKKVRYCIKRVIL